jgi:hypothetical protein
VRNNKYASRVSSFSGPGRNARTVIWVAHLLYDLKSVPGNLYSDTTGRDSTDYGFVNRHARYRLAVGFLFRRVHTMRL